LAAISMSKRTIALVVAVVLAAVATVALVSYVRGYEDRVQRNQELVQVFVAKDVIPKGTTGDVAIERALINQINVPREARADDAITSLDQIKGDVADATIFKGEQILGTRFVPPGRVSADVLTVPPNRVAMSMEVGVPPGVSQFIQIGDHITILAQFTFSARSGGTESRLTKVLLHDIEVLQIGKLVRAAPTEGQPATQSVTVPDGNVLLTLALSMPQAEKLTNAIFNGRLYLTLLPKTGKPSPNTPGRTDSNPFA
jgi:pilus assembly protein CpaB